jgi:hypothetical protein
MSSSEWLNLGSNDSADVFDDAFEWEGAGIDADGSFGADEWSGFALAVALVAFGNGVSLTGVRHG